MFGSISQTWCCLEKYSGWEKKRGEKTNKNICSPHLQHLLIALSTKRPVLEFVLHFCKAGVLSRVIIIKQVITETVEVENVCLLGSGLLKHIVWTEIRIETYHLCSCCLYPQSIWCCSSGSAEQLQTRYWCLGFDLGWWWGWSWPPRSLERSLWFLFSSGLSQSLPSSLETVSVWSVCNEGKQPHSNDNDVSEWNNKTLKFSDVYSLNWTCLHHMDFYLQTVFCHTYLLCEALTEVSVGLTAAVLKISSELDVGESCSGIKSVSIYKEKVLFSKMNTFPQ